MTVNEVYNSLGAFLFELVSTESWEKVELHLKIQPQMLGMSGKLYLDKNSTSVRTRMDSDLKNQVRWLHETTTEGGHNKWNKAKFTITPDKKFDMEFIWDQEWQKEVDENNRQEAEKDPNYTPPKWHWDE